MASGFNSSRMLLSLVPALPFRTNELNGSRGDFACKMILMEASLAEKRTSTCAVRDSLLQQIRTKLQGAIAAVWSRSAERPRWRKARCRECGSLAPVGSHTYEGASNAH